jgi:hypothetical protein
MAMLKDLSPQEAARQLHKAMAGPGTDEATILGILNNETSPQRRQAIETEFKREYGSKWGGDLRSALKNELTRPEYLSARQGLSFDANDQIADVCANGARDLGSFQLLKFARSMEGLNKDERQAFIAAYKAKFNRDIVEDLKDTLAPKTFDDIYARCLKDPNPKLVAEIANHELNSRIKTLSGPADPQRVIRLMGSLSPEQRLEAIQYYNSMDGNPFKESFGTDLLDVLNTWGTRKRSW